MSTPELHNRRDEHQNQSISAVFQDWGREFTKHLELNYADLASGLSPKATSADFRRAMLQAFVITLRESGAAQEEIIQILATNVGQIVPVAQNEEWSGQKSARRLELIDKRIQQQLSPDEAIELARLTELMRACCDTEETLPLEGARRLHRQLLGTGQQECASD